VEEEIYILGVTYWEILEVRNAIDMMHLTKNLCLNVLGFLGCYENSKDTLKARWDLKISIGMKHLRLRLVRKKQILKRSKNKIT
jgi:hypothetical protein